MVTYLLCLVVLVVNVAEAVSIQDGCKVSRCERHEPSVRFPFRLQGLQPPHCSYPHPGFQLSCSENNQTLLKLPRSMKLLVKHIDYKAQKIHLYDPRRCLWRQLLDLNLSAFPFKYEPPGISHLKAYTSGISKVYTLFNCSIQDEYLYPPSNRVACLSTPASQVIAFPSDDFVYYENLLSCSNIGNFSAAIPPDLIGRFELHWYGPNCVHCEVEGRGCRLKSNSTQDQTECFGNTRHHIGARKRLMVAGVVLGSFILAAIATGVGWAYHLDKRKKESRLKIEKFLEDYKALKPSRYSFADIKSITNNFKDKLGQGGYGTVFKGRLSNDILVAVKVLNNFKGNGEEFINEVGSMGRIHHVNVTRLVAFCADGYERALVYEYLPNESLDKFIFAAKGENNRSLSWEKLQDIALGVAKGIEYLHQGCEQRILHFDIKPHNILLDHNFNPKISDFGLAKLCSKEQSAISMTTARGTMGYIAPEVLSRNFGNVSYKSDVYSFGMLLLEMVGGRKNLDVTVENTSQVYFPEWAYNHLDKEELEIRIEDEERTEIAKKLTIIGLWCIQWYPVDRPPIKAVVQMLEGEANTLRVPPNPFSSTDELKIGASTMPRKPANRELATISELD